MESNNQSEITYWCFLCKKETTVSLKDGELVCNMCKSEFIEEVDKENKEDQKKFNPVISTINTNLPTNTPIQNNSNTINFNSLPRVSFQVISSTNGNVHSRIFNSNSNNSNGQIPPLQNLFGHINNLFSFSPGSNISTSFSSNLNFTAPPFSQFLNTHNNDQPFDNLLNYLMMNDPNRYGNPPASKKLVSELPRLKITDSNIKDYENKDCLICMDSFKILETSVRLKCTHLFHGICIIDWLQIHNTCPVCRDEMITDDADYERRKNEGRQILREYNQSSNNSGNSHNHH